MWPHGAKDDLGLMLLGYKEELINYFYSYCKMRSLPQFSLPSPYVESDANPNLLTAISDLRIVGSVGTTCDNEDSSEEFTSLSREIDEYMDVRSL